MLLDVGIFDSNCDFGHAGCTAQILLVDLMYTAASGAINVLGIPIGMFIDGRGPRAAALAGLTLRVFGSSLSLAQFLVLLKDARYPLLVAY